MNEARHEPWPPGDGEMSERRLRRSLEHEGYEVAVFAYRRGTVFNWHAHDADKCDAVVSGTLRIEVAGGAVFVLGPGDRLYVPAGTSHRAEAVGPETVISLDGTKR